MLLNLNLLKLVHNNFRLVSLNLKYLLNNLEKLVSDFPKIITEVRGRGLMLGLKCKIENTKFVEEARNNKILTIKASDNVVRLLPPLNISVEDCDIAISAISETCSKLS